MTLVEMQIHLEQFDEMFINQCKKIGLTQEQSRRELLDNPHRNYLLKVISDHMSLMPNTKYFLELQKANHD